MLSVVLPSKGRGKQARKCIDRLFDTATSEIEIIAIVYPDEEAKKAFSSFTDSDLKRFHLVWSEVSRRDAYQMGAEMAIGKYLLSIDDDRWAFPYWQDNVLEAIQALPDEYGYVKINSNQDDRYWWAETAIATRDFYKNELGGVIEIPHYHNVFSDVEKSERALNKNLFFQSKSYIEHRSHVYNLAPLDKTYIEGGLAHAGADSKTYQDRRSAGFPNDYPPAIK